jgi:hypothetical protein
LLRAIEAFAAMFVFIKLPSTIVDVTVLVSPLVITFPETSGKSIVLSLAVGFATQIVVSNACILEPSKTKLPVLPTNN